MGFSSYSGILKVPLRFLNFFLLRFSKILEGILYSDFRLVGILWKTLQLFRILKTRGGFSTIRCDLWDSFFCLILWSVCRVLLGSHKILSRMLRTFFFKVLKSFHKSCRFLLRFFKILTHFLRFYTTWTFSLRTIEAHRDPSGILKQL